MDAYLQSEFGYIGVTALAIKDEFVFAGEGSKISILEAAGADTLSCLTVFRSARVHGIVPEPLHPLLAVHGRNLLTVVGIDANKRLLILGCCLNDVKGWIVAVHWLSHWQLCVIDSYGTAYHIILSPALRQIVDSTSWMSGLPACDGGAVLPAIGRVHAVCQCPDRCILYSGCVTGHHWIVPCDRETNECVAAPAIFMGGTVFGEVLMWCSDYASSDGVLLHRLRGAVGAVFSMLWQCRWRILVTTSDDRSVRVWRLCDTTTSSSVFDESRDDAAVLKRGTFQNVYTLYGHCARVWRCIFTPTLTEIDSNLKSDLSEADRIGCIVSVGEDSRVCVWRASDGRLLRRWRAHSGADVSAICWNRRQHRVITAGRDASVISWPLRLASMTSSLACALTAQAATTDDFVRSITTLRCCRYLVVSNAGRVLVCVAGSFSPSLNASPGMRMVLHEPRMASYCVVSVSAGQTRLLLASMSGLVIFCADNGQDVLKRRELQLVDGKIFHVAWLNETRLLISYGHNQVKQLHLSDDGEYLSCVDHRTQGPALGWINCACLVHGGANNCDDIAVAGDRHGVLYAFHSGQTEPACSGPVHDRGGVCDLIVVPSGGQGVYSCGRDGNVCCTTVARDRLQVLVRYRLPCQWLAKFVLVPQRLRMPLVAGFRGSNFVLLTFPDNSDNGDGGENGPGDCSEVWRVSCGGGHRSWTISVTGGNNDATATLSWLERRRIVSASIDLHRVPRVLRVGCISGSVMSAVHVSSSGLLAVSGEDATVRLVSVDQCSRGRLRLRCVHTTRAHISSARALCTLPATMADCISGGGAGGDQEPGIIELVSAGGRGQAVLWRVCLMGRRLTCQHSHRLAEQPNEAARRRDMAQPLYGDTADVRYMHLASCTTSVVNAAGHSRIVAAAASDGCVRLFHVASCGNRLQYVACLPVNGCSGDGVCGGTTRCLLRAHWVSLNGCAQLATLSTDGQLRLSTAHLITAQDDQFATSTTSTLQCDQLAIGHLLTCTVHQSGVNASCVVRMSGQAGNLVAPVEMSSDRANSGGDEQRRFDITGLGLTTCSIDGDVTTTSTMTHRSNCVTPKFGELIGVGYRRQVCCRADDGDAVFMAMDGIPETTVTMMTAGVDERIAMTTGANETSGVVMVTGGDDGAVKLSLVSMQKVVPLASNLLAHASQVTGVCCFDDGVVVSVALDQRMCVWRPEYARLRPLSCCYTSVADIKGLLPFVFNGQQLLLVYGEGMELFRITL